MTTEIVIMNKWGIALAADSAVTISLPDGDEGFREKVFSTNKLFMLSKYHPVGVMIYGNAAIMGVPWELVIKEYRKKRLGAKSFPTLEDYCKDFIGYLNQNTFYFPADLQKEHVTVPLAQQLAGLDGEIGDELLRRMREDGDDPIGDEESFNVARWELFGSKLHERVDALQSLPDIEGFTINEDAFYAKYSETILRDVAATIQAYSVDGQSSDSVETAMQRIAYLAVVKDTFGTGIEASGIVIAGYGENAIYPSLIAYDIEGVFDDKLKYVRTHQRIENRNAYIVPFAQGEMIKTFMDGVSPEYQSISEEYLREILVSKFGAEAEQTVDDFKDASSRIVDAVQSLPIGELASMAETLVNLTSFKRRVTPDLETVGGPVDVAVITKGDGFYLDGT
jgi:hypothetical protein